MGVPHAGRTCEVTCSTASAGKVTRQRGGGATRGHRESQACAGHSMEGHLLAGTAHPALTGILPATDPEDSKEKREGPGARKTASVPHTLAKEKGHLRKQLQFSKAQLDVLGESEETRGSGSCRNKGQGRGSGALKSPMSSPWKSPERHGNTWQEALASLALRGDSFRSFCLGT